VCYITGPAVIKTKELIESQVGFHRCSKTGSNEVQMLIILSAFYRPDTVHPLKETKDGKQNLGNGRESEVT
jgi:hypothetical protein